MRRTLLVSAALYAAVFVIPLLTSGQVPMSAEPSEAPSEQGVQDTPHPTQTEPSAQPSDVSSEVPPSPFDERTVSVLVDGAAVELTLRELIIGAVAAEMPALYPPEALKAQAVVIRTLALYAEEQPYHEGASLCDDFSCCLAYAPLSDKAEVWAEDFQEYSKKITQAVLDTDGIVVLYEGKPIEALFFAATDGRTRSAAEVWGSEIPYLQSVASILDLNFPGENRGHGVGMSQYGARQMALDGSGYEEILAWYYTGVEIGGG